MMTSKNAVATKYSHEVATPVALRTDGANQLTTASNVPRDQIRWGPVLAGLVTALATMLLLNLLGVALGLASTDVAAAVRRNSAPAEAGQYAAVWSAVSAAIAFFVGGYVAGKSAAVFNRGAGAMNGAMVFLLAVPVTLWLASIGMGALMGTLGSFAGGLNVEPGQIQNSLQDAAQQAREAIGGQVGATEAAQAANTARTAAWGALIGMLIGLGAAAVGGSIGTRSDPDSSNPQN